MTPEYQKQILTNAPALVSKKTQYVTTGNDLDAMLSTALYMHYNPHAIVTGIYGNFSWFLGDVYDHSLYLDLDMCKPNIQSLGHHIRMEYNNSNPNAMQHNVTVTPSTAISHKYPFSTAHILYDLYNTRSVNQLALSSLVWMCDSAICNYVNYNQNCSFWLHDMFEPASVIHLPSYEPQYTSGICQDVLTRNNIPFITAPNHALKLTGLTQEVNYNELIYKVACAAGIYVDTNNLRIDNTKIEILKRNSISTQNAITLETINQHLSNPNIISYAIISSKTLNYTTRG